MVSRWLLCDRSREPLYQNCSICSGLTVKVLSLRAKYTSFWAHRVRLAVSCYLVTWWRHDKDALALLTLCEGAVDSPSQRVSNAVLSLLLAELTVEQNIQVARGSKRHGAHLTWLYCIDARWEKLIARRYWRTCCLCHSGDGYDDGDGTKWHEAFLIENAKCCGRKAGFQKIISRFLNIFRPCILHRHNVENGNIILINL